MSINSQTTFRLQNSTSEKAWYSLGIQVSKLRVPWGFKLTIWMLKPFEVSEIDLYDLNLMPMVFPKEIWYKRYDMVYVSFNFEFYLNVR